MSEWFSRSEALLGGAAMARLHAARVLVVGVGGVGSWCAEALVRTGLGEITLVDDDVVAESNVNRQCPATAATVGRAKVEAMAERLRTINPSCEIVGITKNGFSGLGRLWAPEYLSRSSPPSETRILVALEVSMTEPPPTAMIASQ